MPARPRILLLLALVTLGAAVAAAPAQAAWTAPQTIVADDRAANVIGAGNRHGSQAFIWKVTSKRLIRRGGRSGFASYVRARIRLSDGRLGRVQTISSTTGLVAGPQIGVDESGNVTAVWTQAGRRLSIMAAFRAHGKRFGAPVEIGRSQHFNDARPALAVGRFGDGVIAWNQGRSVQVVRRGPPLCVPQRARACFSQPVVLRAGADQTVAIGPLGSAYVVWAAEVRSADDVHTRLRMAVIRRSGRRAGREHFISSTGDAGQPSLAVAADGSAGVAWRASLPAGGQQNDFAPIMAASSSPDALLAPPQAVSTARGDDPQLRIGPQGEAVLAWNQFDPGPANPDGGEIAVAIRPAGGGVAFGAPALISPPGVQAQGVSLAVDAAGSSYVLYSADSGAGGTVAVTQIRSPGSIFGAPITLPPSFGGGSLLAAGPKITAVSAFTPTTAVSDWTP
jgi:hypothetical protein